MITPTVSCQLCTGTPSSTKSEMTRLPVTNSNPTTIVESSTVNLRKDLTKVDDLYLSETQLRTIVSGKNAVSRIDSYNETALFKQEFVINLKPVEAPDRAQQVKEIMTDFNELETTVFVKDNPQPETNLNGLDSTVLRKENIAAPLDETLKIPIDDKKIKMALAKLIDHENNNLIDGMVDYMVNGNSIYLSSCYPFIKTFQDLNDFNKIKNKLYSKKCLKRFSHYFYLNYAHAQKLWASEAKRPDNLKTSEVNTTLYQKQYNHNRSMASKIFKEDFTPKDNQKWPVKQWLFNCFKKNSNTSNTTNTSSPSATLSEEKR